MSNWVWSVDSKDNEYEIVGFKPNAPVDWYLPGYFCKLKKEKTKTERTKTVQIKRQYILQDSTCANAVWNQYFL